MKRDERRGLLLVLATLILQALIVLGIAGCPASTPQPHPAASDAGPPPSSAEVCLKLAALGCDEGIAPNCQQLLEQAQAEHLTAFPAACWVKATTPAEARACGQLACSGVP